MTKYIPLSPTVRPSAVLPLVIVLILACVTHGTAQSDSPKKNNRTRPPIGQLLDKPGAIEGNRSWKDAWRFETPNFMIKSNISPEATREIGKVMEGLVHNFNKMFNANISQKIKVLVPKTRSQFEQIRRVNRQVRGWFSPRGRIVTYYQPEEGFSTTDVLLHEGTHLVVMVALTKLNTPDVWVNEGTAVYFEASEFEGTSLVIGKKPKRRLLHVKKMIEQDEHVPLRQLIKKSKEEFTAKDYAQAWSLVYYLIHSHDHKWVKRFNKYLVSFKKDQQMDPVRRFHLAFRMRIEKLEKDWLRYVKKMDVNDEDTVKISNPGH